MNIREKKLRGNHFASKVVPLAPPPKTGGNKMRNFSLSTIRPMMEKGTMRKQTAGTAALRRVD